jgi:molybdenum cofactor synthesis domain-containing protein
LKFAILTISDRSARGEREDETGPALRARLAELGHEAAAAEVLPDVADEIERRLIELADSGAADVILTAGGTGLSPRDVTPEATTRAAERLVPGMAEAMRARSLEKTPNAMLSRAIAGARGRCLIVNLPGSPRGAIECLDVIAPALEHAVAVLTREVADWEHRP